MTHHNRRQDRTPAPNRRRPGPAYWAACTITCTAAALTTILGPSLRGLVALAVCLTSAAVAFVVGRETEGR